MSKPAALWIMKGTYRKVCSSERSHGEMADTRDLKSLALTGVWVRLPLRALKNNVDNFKELQ